MGAYVEAIGEDVKFDRAYIFDALKVFYGRHSREAKFLALSQKHWADLQRDFGCDNRPETICGLTLLGTDSPVFYLA